MADEVAGEVDDGPVEIHVTSAEGDDQATQDGKNNDASSDSADNDAADSGEGDKSDNGDDTKAEPLRDEKGRYKGGAEGRIASLTFLRREAERQRDAALALLSEAQAGKAPANKPVATDFDDYGDYVEALTDWKVADRERTNATKNAETAGKAADQHRAAEWSARIEASKPAMPDFDAVMAKADTPTAPHVAQAIMEADQGPELLYHLAQNPGVVDKLNDMSPARAAIELGRIEATLKAPAPAPKPREVTTSRAPAPITPVTPGSSASKDPSKMSMDEYLALRKASGIR